MVIYPDISMLNWLSFPIVTPGPPKQYIAFSFNSMSNELLASDIISICSLINKGDYVVECPTGSSILDYCSVKGEKKGVQGNNVFFYMDSLEFISKINLNATRRFTIYNLSISNYNQLDLKCIKKEASFFVVFENYLEISSIFVKKSDYSEEEIQKLIFIANHGQ